MKNLLKKSLIKLLVVAVLVGMSPTGVFATDSTNITNFTGTIDYSELSTTPIEIAPTVAISKDSSYLEAAIDGGRPGETLGLKTVTTPDATNGVVSAVGNKIYMGNGSSADIIGGIDTVKNGTDGKSLKIAFSRPLTNSRFSDPEVGGVIPGWTKYLGTVTLGALATRSTGSALTISGTTSPYTVTKDPNGYTYQTDFNYGSGTDGTANATAWTHESVERPTGTLNTTVSIVGDATAAGGKALQLTSDGNVVGNNGSGDDVRYGSHFGPYVVSSTFAAIAGEALSLDWKAQYVSDHYEVYGFLVNTATDEHTIVFYGRGENQGWTSSSGEIPATGTYQFKFVNGTYDKTGGYAVGSQMWINNIVIYGNNFQSAETVQKVARLLTYVSTDQGPVSTRNVTLTIDPETGLPESATKQISIVNQFNHPPTISATSLNPLFTNGMSQGAAVFSEATVSTIEAGQVIKELVVQVDGIQDNGDEFIEISNDEILLADGESKTLQSSGMSVSVSMAGVTATLTCTHAGISTNEIKNIIEQMAYNNKKSGFATGNRVVTLKTITDDGGTTNGGIDVRTINLASTVNVKNVVSNLALTSSTSNTVNLSFTVPGDATAQVIQVSSDGGTTWASASHAAISSSASAIAVEGLSVGVNYRFRMMVTGGLLAGPSNIVSATLSAPSSSGGGNKTTSAVPVIVNGETQSAGTQSQTVVDGIKNITVDVNEEIISQKIDNILASTVNTGLEDNIIEIPVASADGDTVKVALTGDLVQKMEKESFTLKVTANDVSYIIPSEEIKIAEVAKELGTGDNLESIEIKINIIQPSAEIIAKIAEQAKAQEYEILIPPVSFEVTAVNTLTKEEKSISKFNNYVQRMFEIPAGVDPNKITTGIVYNNDGTFSHIPTEVVLIDGKYYAKLNSLTNSTYSVIWNPITVASVENHWSKEAVNDMASRLVIADPETFDPADKITRGDFAEYITKALGIYRTGVAAEGLFTDVKKTDGLADAIKTAVDYGIIKGYTDGTFKPNATITREEAMVMYNRAMSVTKLVGSDTNRINNYTDYALVSGWAKENVKQVIAAKVFNGVNSTTLAPKATLTTAEAATAVRNLLVQSNLINE